MKTSTLAGEIFIKDHQGTDKLLREVLLVISGSLFIALMAQIRIPLPFTPVPITGQTLAILLIGATFGSKRGAITTLLYLLEGGLGLPFFAGGAAGMIHFMGPTGGYLVGFVLSAFLTGYLCEKGIDKKLKTAIPFFMITQLPIFFCGVLWMSLLLKLNFTTALQLGFLPFIPGEIIKALLAGSILPTCWKALGRSR